MPLLSKNPQYMDAEAKSTRRALPEAPPWPFNDVRRASGSDNTKIAKKPRNVDTQDITDPGRVSLDVKVAAGTVGGDPPPRPSGNPRPLNPDGNSNSQSSSAALPATIDLEQAIKMATQFVGERFELERMQSEHARAVEAARRHQQATQESQSALLDVMQRYSIAERWGLFERNRADQAQAETINLATAITQQAEAAYSQKM